MTSEGEQRPLLPKKQSSGGSVRFSDSVVDRFRDESSLSTLPPAFGEIAPDRRLAHSDSSAALIFQRLTKSERAEALSKEGVGGAAFLIRDAVLGNANPSAGAP